MKYTYYALFHLENRGVSFIFVDLPSGVLYEENKDEMVESAQEVLMELLSDEDFLPHDSLPISHMPDRCELCTLAKQVFYTDYNDKDFILREIIVEDD